MQYPSKSQYYSTIRHPQIAFRKKDPKTKVEQAIDADLLTGKPVEIPNKTNPKIKDIWVASGSFACVFKYETSKNIYAIRCFNQSISNCDNHYKKLSEKLHTLTCSHYFLDFTFLDEGIRVEGNLYPILKMEWAEGKDLKTFIKDNLNNKTKLNTLAQTWLKLSKDLLDAGVAHGDLQHGNILVNEKSGINFKLIDYDSLYFSSDGNAIDDQIKGIPDYQHPLRASLEKQCLEIDFFSQIVIYISILALAENKNLWEKYNLDNTERLLFCTSDYLSPEQSQIFKDISQLSSNISHLANELKQICNIKKISEIPSLEQILPSFKITNRVDATQVLINTKLNNEQSSVTNYLLTIEKLENKNKLLQEDNQSLSIKYNDLEKSVNKLKTSKSELNKQITKYNQQRNIINTITGASIIATGILGGLNYLQSQQIDQLKKQTENLRGQFDNLQYINGIGIGLPTGKISTDEISTIIKVYPNTPAFQKGIKVGDKIESIDGISTRSLSETDLTDLIIGKVNTQVTLKISRPDDQEYFDITLTRERIKLPKK